MYQTLTADDVKAMRKLEPSTQGSIAVHLGAGKLCMRLSSRTERDGMTCEAAREIPVNQMTTEIAFFHLYAYTGVWQAICALVRPGDALILSARENGNEYTRDAGINVDELLLTIRRGDRTIVREMLIDASHCPNNLARAIRVA